MRPRIKEQESPNEGEKQLHGKGTTNRQIYAFLNHSKHFHIAEKG
jgi:hypothetical protein